jgi:hypothetical protein
MIKEKQYKQLVFIFSFLFVGLCIYNYLSSRPLWLDEMFVYKNIVQFKPHQLFAVLNPVQSFPRVYLIGIQFLGSFFNNHVLALRFFPLICMICAFYLWIKIYEKNLKDSKLLFLILLAFLASHRMVYYAAEFKPYSMDVLLAALYMMFFAYQNQFLDKKPTKKLYIISFILPFVMFFSYGALFFFWLSIIHFILMIKHNRSLMWVTFLHTFISIVCFIAFYQIDIQYSITKAGVNYWQSYFISYDSVGDFFDTFGSGVKKMVRLSFGASSFLERASTGLVPVGIISLFYNGFKAIKEGKGKIFNIDMVALILFFELFLLGSLQKYPFSGGRLILFFTPFLFYLIVKGLYQIRTVKFLGKCFMGYYIIYCFSAFVYSIYNFGTFYLQ